MITVRDSEKEYSLSGWGKQLLVQDLENPDDYYEVAERDFSEFEASVYKFLAEVK